MPQINQWNRAVHTPAPENATHGAILTSVEARGGVVSGRIILLLAASLTLVVVAFVIVYAVQV